MDLEREIKRLKKTQASLCALAWLLAIGFVGWLAFRQFFGTYWDLSVVREANSVRLTTVSDGPFVVTHLTVRGREVDSEGEKRTAALDPPLAIIDSHGGRIEDIRRLKWIDLRGEPADPPGPETKLTALYFRPQWAEPRER